MERPFRHPVETDHKRVGYEIQFRKRRFNRRLQRADIARVVMIRRQRADRRMPSHGGKRGICLIQHSTRRRP